MFLNVGVYTRPQALFRAEMASLAHLSWVLVPLTLVLGALALGQFVRRRGEIGGRYAHAGAVVVLWVIYLGAQYYTLAHPAWAVGGLSRVSLDAAGLTLLGGTAAGLTLRHTKPERSRTPRVLAWHLTMAAGTALFVLVGLWPYR
jgi:hypothetical protein